VHTDWCLYCRLLLNKTFTNGQVSQFLNAGFYALKLNAEANGPLQFAGKEYTFQPSGNGTGQHDLANKLASQHGQVIYPTLVVLDEKYQLLNRHVGFIKPQSLLDWLQASELHSK
jgi:thioredoxin-related protein